MTQDSNAPHDEYQCRPEVCGGIHYDPCTAASRGGVAVTTYVVTDGPKMLRETLCAAQVAIGDTYHADPRIHEHMDRLQRLIDALPDAMFTPGAPSNHQRMIDEEEDWA